MGEAFPSLKRAPLTMLSILLWLPRACWRGRRRILIVLAALVAIHLTATVITGLMLRRELNRMRQAGEPMEMSKVLTPAQLEPVQWNRPGSPNAAWVYEHAFQTFALTKDEEEEYANPPYAGSTQTSTGEPITPAQVAAARLAFARRVIPKNERYFQLLEEASRVEVCAFPVRWDAGAAAIFPHFAQMREAARWLALRAELLTSDGNLDEALGCCATMLRIAEHAKTEPTLIGQLVAYAIQGIACKSLENTLSAGRPSPAACRALYDQIGAIDQIGPSVRTMQGERVIWGMWFYDELRRHPLRAGALVSGGAPGEDGNQHRWLALYPSLGRPLLNLDQVTYLRLQRQETAAFGQPWPESLRTIKALDKEVERLPIYRGTIARMIFPVFSRALESRESKTALLRAAQISLALKVYKAEHGAYPDSLAELEKAGWKLPTDPFTQKPYYYRRDGAGFVVWSAGPDMDDDDGRPLNYERLGQFSEEQSERERNNYDIPFPCAQ